MLWKRPRHNLTLGDCTSLARAGETAARETAHMSEPDRHGRGVRIGKLESKNNRGPGAFIGQGVDVSIEHAELSGNTGGGIIIGSDAVGQLSLLGLPSSMPGLDVAELLQALRDAHGNSGDERRAIIRRSTAWA